MKFDISNHLSEVMILIIILYYYAFRHNNVRVKRFCHV